MSDIESKKIDILYKSQGIKIDYFFRRGQKETLFYLHGLGCSKSDFFETAQIKSFQAYTLVAFDFPGHGNSSYPINFALDIDDLVEITELIRQKFSLDNVILVGHSLGGLVALLYIEKYMDKVKAFINVEGNLDADDCFFSREVIKYSYEDFVKRGFDAIKSRVAANKNEGFQVYTNHLKKVEPKAYFDYCPSMTKYSTEGHLVERFLALPLPKLFIYGSENKHLAYLPELLKGGITVAEISNSNHWPNHDNPEEFYKTISNFLFKVQK